MARFERSGGKGSGDSKRKSSKRGFRRNEGSDSSSFEEHQKNRRSAGRSSGKGSRVFRSRDRDRSRPKLEMTKVTCSACGIDCEVPFKPTSSKPVYCSNCYAKSDNGGSSRGSAKDFEIINEKLNKIMDALNIK